MMIHHKNHIGGPKCQRLLSAKMYSNQMCRLNYDFSHRILMLELTSKNSRMKKEIEIFEWALV